MTDQTWKCKWCKKRIPREAVVIATSRGKAPAYCNPTHRNAGKAKARRDRLKLSTSSARTEA